MARDSGGKRKKRRQKRVGSVDVDPDLEKIKEVMWEAQEGAHGLKNNCRESAFPLSRLLRGFRNKYH